MERTWLPCQQNPTPSCGIMDTHFSAGEHTHTAPYWRWHQAVFLPLLWVTGSRVYANSAKHRTWQIPPQRQWCSRRCLSPKRRVWLYCLHHRFPKGFINMQQKCSCCSPAEMAAWGWWSSPGPASSWSELLSLQPFLLAACSTATPHLLLLPWPTA